MRKALCIGIDNYPSSADRLYGCVNDVTNWSNTFKNMGFDVKILIEGAAKKHAILEEIRSIVLNSKSGDVIAIQFSSHGSQVPDLQGDEADFLDEVQVPFDHRENGYVRDNDLARIGELVKFDVNVTMFFDMCMVPPAVKPETRTFSDDAQSVDRRARFLPADDQMKAAHVRSCANVSAYECDRLNTTVNESNPSMASLKPGNRFIGFQGCSSGESAFEHDGQGDFSRHALKVLNDDTPGMTNLQFINIVSSKLRYQTPRLFCNSDLCDQLLLEPLKSK